MSTTSHADLVGGGTGQPGFSAELDGPLCCPVRLAPGLNATP